MPTFRAVDLWHESESLEASGLESLYGGQFTFSLYRLLINQTFVSTPQRRSTTVCLETNPLSSQLADAASVYKHSDANSLSMPCFVSQCSFDSLKALHFGRAYNRKSFGASLKVGEN